MPKTTRILHPEFALIQRKPVGGVRIKEKYLRMGLRGLWTMENGRFTNLVTGKAATALGSGVTHSVRAGQLCAHTTSTDGGNVIKVGAPLDFGLPGASDVTMLFKGDIDEASSNVEQSVFGVYEQSPAVSTRFYWRQDNVNNNIDCWVRHASKDAQYPCPTTLTTWYHDSSWQLNEIHTLGVRFSSSRGAIDYFEDGINHGGSAVVDGPLTTTANSNQISIGGRDGSSIDNWRGNIYWCALFVGGYVPDSVLEKVTRTGSPSEFLEPAIPLVLAGVAAVGATVSPTTGKALLSGKAPTVFREVSVSPTVGTAILSGHAPTVVTEVAATVQPTTGAAIFSGLAPITFKQVVQAPTTGKALLSGLTPTVTGFAGAVVSPTTGTAIFSGLAPTTFREVAVSPTTGKITYSGVAPTVFAEKSASPTTGKATFSGLAPTVSAAVLATVQPTTGAALLSGLTPTVSVQRTAFPGAGAAIFSGKTPTTSVFVNLTPTTGTAIFSGKTPSAGPFIGTTVSPTLGKIALSGKSLTVTKDAIFGVWNPIDEVSTSWTPYTRATTTWTDL